MQLIFTSFQTRGNCFEVGARPGLLPRFFSAASGSEDIFARLARTMRSNDWVGLLFLLEPAGATFWPNGFRNAFA